MSVAAGFSLCFHLQAWVVRNAPKLQSLGATLARSALNVSKGAVSTLATLGTIFALLALLLLEGPKMAGGCLILMPLERCFFRPRSTFATPAAALLLVPGAIAR